MTTFYKLGNGEWGVKGPALIPGDRVAVKKADGSRSYVTIKKVLQKANGGESIASIERAPKYEDDDVEELCDSCHEYPAKVPRTDMTGKEGQCCYQCAKLRTEKLAFS